jgi:hypothetical protein
MTPVFAALLIAALMAFVAWLISSPFRRPAAAGEAAAGGGDERRALESARESKYTEIRDNETDFRTGKLSQEDYDGLDRALRAEAVEIIRALDELDGETVAGTAASR